MTKIKILVSAVLVIGATIGVSAVALLSRTPDFCDSFPTVCEGCPAGVGQCGEPDIWVCCDEGEGCVAVVQAADCEGDLYSCDWGESTSGPGGKPAVICYD